MLSAFKLPGVRSVLALYALDATLELGLAVVLMVLVYEQTASPVLVALMLTCKQIVPGLITGVSGLGLDRVAPRRAFALAGVLRLLGLLMVGVPPFGVSTFVGAALLGFAGAAGRTVFRAVLVGAAGDAFRRASASLNLVTAAACVYGPLLGAALATTLGTRQAVLVWGPVALGVAVGAGVLTRPGGWQSNRSADEPDGDAEQAAGSVADAARARRLLVLAGVAMLAFSMDEPALLAFVERSLGGGVGEYSWLLAFWGAGMLLAGPTYSRLVATDVVRIFAGSVAVVGLAYLGLSAAGSMPVAFGVAIVGGFANGLLAVSLMVCTLEATSRASVTRGSALLEIVNTAMPAIGMILGGLLAEFVSLRATLAVPGVVTLAALALWAVIESRAQAPGSVPSLLPSSSEVPA